MARPVVLVAEDDQSIQLTLRFVLEDEGFEVLFASDGEEALHLARRRSPDVILLDLMMPKLTGREVLDALRADDGTSAIPVMLLTGMSRSELEEIEDVQFLMKPFSPEDLVGRVREMINPQ